MQHYYFTNDSRNGYIGFFRGNSCDDGFLTFGTSGLERLRINSSGYIGIGTANPQHMLDVKGRIRATEIVIESVDKFADFVFDSQYKLPSLRSVKQYIEKNKHLPGIPSAEEVKEKGMSLVEMQVKLLQKIEELTLYTIEQQKQIEELQRQISQ